MEITMSLSDQTLYLILGLIALLTAVLVFNWALAVRHLKRGVEFRGIVARKVQSLRLHKMLGAVGIDPSRYLDRASVPAIEQHVRSCENCPNTGICDERLGAEQGAARDYSSFCPNFESLKTLDR